MARSKNSETVHVRINKRTMGRLRSAVRRAARVARAEGKPEPTISAAVTQAVEAWLGLHALESVSAEEVRRG